LNNENKIDVNGVNIDNVYSDIRLLHNHLKVTDAYDKLKSDKDFTAVAISSMPNVKGLEFLIKKFTSIYFNKQVLHSRRAHQLMFEYGTHGVNSTIGDIIQIRDFMYQIEVCTLKEIRSTKFDIESIIYPNGFEYVGESMKVFPSRRQKNMLLEIQQSLGLRTEGVAALMIVIWTLNATFKNMDTTYENERDLMLLDTTKEWWSDDENSIKQQITKYVNQYRNDNLIKLKKTYEVLRVEVKLFNENKETVIDNKRFECVKKILEKIENSGVLNNVE
jgi:hypothetical protein